MKKSERPWVIVLLLKQHGKLTAYELANNLEVQSVLYTET